MAPPSELEATPSEKLPPLPSADGRTLVLRVAQKMWDNAAQRKVWREEAEAAGQSGSATFAAWHVRVFVVRSKSSLKAFAKHNAEEVAERIQRQLPLGEAATPFRVAKMRMRTDEEVCRDPPLVQRCKSCES